MRAIVELGFDFISRISCAPIILHCGILGQRITSLDHEPFYDAMESRAIVKALLSEGLEILDGFWRYIRPEIENHLACSCFNYRNFIRLRAHVPSKIHYLTESAGTILIDFTSTRFVGLLGSPLLLATTGVSLIFFSTS